MSRQEARSGAATTGKEGLEVSARVRANRANARRSTGPRSAAGKARAARNACRHGLAVAIAALPDYEPAVGRLTRLIAGAGAGAEHIVEARRVAEAELDLLRIRRVRLRLMAPEAEMTDDAIRLMARLDRYERGARARRTAAVAALDALGLCREGGRDKLDANLPLEEGTPSGSTRGSKARSAFGRGCAASSRRAGPPRRGSLERSRGPPRWVRDRATA